MYYRNCLEFENAFVFQRINELIDDPLQSVTSAVISCLRYDGPKIRNLILIPRDVLSSSGQTAVGVFHVVDPFW